MNMPILLPLNSSFAFGLSGALLRYSALAFARSASAASAVAPCGEENAVFELSGAIRSPPASHSIATYFQTSVSLPSIGHSRPNCVFEASVSALASATSSSHVQSGFGSASPAAANRSLL